MNSEASKAPVPSKYVAQKPKRKREGYKGSDMDDYNEGNFWERVLNNQDCGWTMVQRMLEHLTAQWKLHVEEAASIATEYNSKTNENGELNEDVDQEEILAMIKTASKQRERMTSIANRFVAMSMISKEQARKAGIPKQQVEHGIKSAIDQTKVEEEKLNRLLNSMYGQMRKAITKSKVQVERALKENEDLKLQLQNSKDRRDETIQELHNHIEHWKQRMKEEEEYERKLKERHNELQQDHKAAIERFDVERDELRRKIRTLEREMSNMSKPGSSRQEDHPSSKCAGPKQERQPNSQPEAQRAESKQAVKTEPNQRTESKQAVKTEPDKRAEAIEDIKRRIRHLERDLERYENAKRVPPRILTERSEKMDYSLRCAFCNQIGLHFSDSCPRITDPRTRKNIVARSGRCPRCLDFCGGKGLCLYERKRCKYCEKARGTVLESTRPQVPHHTALCEIPVQREQLGQHIERIRDQIMLLKEQVRAA
ncbi:hypothetical protein Q1695_003358 [Nippostrongylus brasiliensis]|nr:hypothetical protein Q1695_003358 [Nippostrongylus brasiliensis]